MADDTSVRILVVAKPTAELLSAESEVRAVCDLIGNHGGYTVEVDVLPREEATREAFSRRLSEGDYDILHFAGHAFLDPSRPEQGALRLADGPLSADEVLDLPWKAPPYFVFNCACEAGRAAGGKCLVSRTGHHNGLAAAFLAAGVYGYAGYFWPVSDAGAGLFTHTFYGAHFESENVGLAFLEARRRVARELEGSGDLTAHSAILFGDAASKHRRDLATAV